MSIQAHTTDTDIEEKTVPVSEFQRIAYQDLCGELKELLTMEKEIAKRKEELKASVLSLSGGERMEYGIKIQQRIVKGTVDYKKIVSDMGFSEEEAEEYRKATRVYWDVRSY